MTAAAHNNRKKDAQLLYIMVFASLRFAAPVELRTFIASKRDDFFAMDVICHARLGIPTAAKEPKSINEK